MELVKPVFSFFLSNNEQLSGKVIIGGYDIAKYATLGLTEADIIWSNLVSHKDYFWTLSMNQARMYGGKPKDHQQIYATFPLSSNKLIIDTGLSYALAPLRDLN